MAVKKTNLGLLFGGRSCEHEVSVISARSILKAVDRDKYNVVLIGIDKSGRWHLGHDIDELLTDGAVKLLDRSDSAGKKSGDLITLDLHHHGNLSGQTSPPPVDVMFPALHGTFGEDGTIQGVLEMAGIPYIGCGVAASALAMDKLLAKKVFAAAGIPQAGYIGVGVAQWQHGRDAIIASVETKLGYPLFVKPANLGSSVGISKATDREQLLRAVDVAFRFDNKIVLEQAMQGCLEVECAVLGNAGAADSDAPQASVVGQIIPGAEFYDYATKYLNDNAELLVPAKIPDSVAEQVRELSLAAFAEIDGAGLARVDFFVEPNTWQVTLNELNTLPGFTPISMYPRLWKATGIPYAQLINRLIDLAVKSHQAKAALQRDVEADGASPS